MLPTRRRGVCTVHVSLCAWPCGCGVGLRISVPHRRRRSSKRFDSLSVRETQIRQRPQATTTKALARLLVGVRQGCSCGRTSAHRPQPSSIAFLRRYVRIHSPTHTQSHTHTHPQSHIQVRYERARTRLSTLEREKQMGREQREVSAARPQSTRTATHTHNLSLSFCVSVCV